LYEATGDPPFHPPGALPFSMRLKINIRNDYYYYQIIIIIIHILIFTQLKLDLLKFYGIFARRGLELRGRWAQSAIGDADSLNRLLKLTGSSTIGKKQTGFYVAAAYDILPLLAKGKTSALLPFVQYEKLNFQSEVPAGFSANAANERTNLTYGIALKPHPNVAFKLDYLNRRNEAQTAVAQFNVAVNYLF
jgi:hypothetical protein